MKNIFLFLFVILMSLNVFPQCADTTNIVEFTFNGKVYEVIKEKKSWSDAAACAVERGGYLVEIGSREEQVAVHAGIIDSAAVSNNYVVVNNGGGIAYVWIGATDQGTEGTWLWDGNNDGAGVNFWTGQGANGDNNGSAVDEAYINWGGTAAGQAREPDDWSGQDHAAIGLTGWPAGSTALGRPGEWNDIIGSSRLYFVVEYDSLSSGINIHKKPEFKIYPNPSTGIINVRGFKIQEIEVIDYTGRTVKFSGTLMVDLTEYPRGIYFIKVTSIEGVITRKIVLQ
jgi:hypothetical protein